MDIAKPTIEGVRIKTTTQCIGPKCPDVRDRGARFDACGRKGGQNHDAGMSYFRKVRFNRVVRADVYRLLRRLPPRCAQAIVADPPYFRVLPHPWDRQWSDVAEYVLWLLLWVSEAMRVLKDDGLLFVFGQVGRLEHGFIHACSMLCLHHQFHDLLIWDRVVGYNERRDSFTPAYELVLVLRKSDQVKFRKGRARTPYDPETIRKYLRDGRYKNKPARLAHLSQGKYLRNILAVPSLRGSSHEKVGHPSQKPLALMRKLLLLATDPGDLVIDLFSGSGSTSVAAKELGRDYLGVESDPAYCEMARRRLAKIDADRYSSPTGTLIGTVAKLLQQAEPLPPPQDAQTMSARPSPKNRPIQSTHIASRAYARTSKAPQPEVKPVPPPHNALTPVVPLKHAQNRRARQTTDAPRTT